MKFSIIDDNRIRLYMNTEESEIFSGEDMRSTKSGKYSIDASFAGGTFTCKLQFSVPRRRAFDHPALTVLRSGLANKFSFSIGTFFQMQYRIKILQMTRSTPIDPDLFALEKNLLIFNLPSVFIAYPIIDKSSLEPKQIMPPQLEIPIIGISTLIKAVNDEIDILNNKLTTEQFELEIEENHIICYKSYTGRKKISG